MPAQSEVLVLKAGSEEARSALLRGWIDQGSERIRVVPEEVLAGPLMEIAFRRIHTPRPSRLRAYFSSIRAYSLTATGLPGFAVLVLGLSLGLQPNFGFFSLAFFAALFLQIGVNVLNDVEDHIKLIDLPGGPGGSQTLQKGWVTARELRVLGTLSLVVGALLGLPVVVEYWRALLPLGAIALAGSFAYSSGPFGLKYRALGDLDVFLLCGPLLSYGFSWSAFGSSPAGVFYLGGFFGLLACGILHVNNIQDIPIDTQRGARTLASVLGFKKAKWLLALYYGGAYALLLTGFFMGALPPTSLFALAALPLFATLLIRCNRASGPDSPRLIGLRVLAAQGHLIAGVAMTLATAITIFLFE